MRRAAPAIIAVALIGNEATALELVPVELRLPQIAIIGPLGDPVLDSGNVTFAWRSDDDVGRVSFREDVGDLVFEHEASLSDFGYGIALRLGPPPTPTLIGFDVPDVGTRRTRVMLIPTLEVHEGPPALIFFAAVDRRSFESEMLGRFVGPQFVLQAGFTPPPVRLDGTFEAGDRITFPFNTASGIATGISTGEVAQRFRVEAFAFRYPVAEPQSLLLGTSAMALLLSAQALRRQQTRSPWRCQRITVSG